MDNFELKLYLSQCIKKNRYKKYNQHELSKDICSKYTLSRIENKSADININTIYQLLNRLNLYYKDVLDYSILITSLKHLTYLIEDNDSDKIRMAIKEVNIILNRNKNNVIFENQRLLYEYLVTHYINKERIFYNTNDYLLFEYCESVAYTLIVHIFCENMLYYGRTKEFYSYYNNLKHRQGTILLDFFNLYYLQINGQILEANNIFQYHKETFIKDFKSYQLLRYRSIIALGYIKYEPDKALYHFDKITQVYNKANIKNHYYLFCILGYASVFIKRKQYQEALDLILEQYELFPFLLPTALPFIIFLSFRVKFKLHDKFLIKGNTPLCDACVDYYNYHVYEDNGTLLVKHLHRTIPKLLIFLNISDPVVQLIKAEAQEQVNKSHCYKSGIKFDQKLKYYCKEVSTL